MEGADNDIIIIRSTDLVGKPIILKPQSGVHFPRVFQDVGWRSVPWWKDDIEDVLNKGLRSWQVGAQASVLTAVIASTITRVVAMACPLPRITMGMSTCVEGVARVMLAAETLMHRDRGAWLTILRHLVD